mgnify:CR=1 FL=1
MSLVSTEDFSLRRLGVVLHAQLGVQLDEPVGLLTQLALLREGLRKLLEGILDLTLKVVKANVEGVKRLANHRHRVLNAAYVAPRVRAQLDVVLKLSLEREDVFAEGLQRDLHVKATECADVDGLRILHRGQDIQSASHAATRSS